MNPSLKRRARTLRNHRDALHRGFTLLEILVVLAIIGLLAGLAITNVDKIFGDARVGTTQIFVRDSMKTSFTTYLIHMGEYPPNLEALNTRPSAKGDRWNGPYTADGRIPPDPWGEPYQYAYPGTRNKGKFDFWSKGPDKQSGTTDDIGNWDTSAGGEK